MTHPQWPEARDGVILVAGRTFPTYGAARVVIDLAEGLLASGVQVTIVTFDGGDASNAKAVPIGVDHHHLQRRPGVWGWIRAIFRLRKFASRQSPMVYLSFLSTYNLLTLIALYGLGRSVYPTEHNQQSIALRNYGAKKHLILWLTRRVYGTAKSVICVSDAVRNDLAEECKIERARFKVVLNPVDSKRLVSASCANAGEARFREKHIKYIGCVAELKPAKAQRHLIRLLQVLPSNFQLVLFGDGPDFVSLQSLASRLAVGHRVHFTGRLDNPWVHAKNMKATILMPEFEGFGLAVAESAAFGVIPVTNGVGGLAEVTAAVGGLVVPPGMSNDLERIARVVQDAVDRDYEVPAPWLESRMPENVAREYLDIIGLP